MAELLARTPRPRRLILPAHAWVGRGARCWLRLSEVDVSLDHATLRWSGQDWELRDLGSRNGTYRNGERLTPGLAVKLRRGDELRFGEDALWCLEDDRAPGLFAVDLETDRVIAGTDDYLPLPDPESPSASVFRGADGRWVLEAAEKLRLVSDGDEIDVRGRRFAVYTGQGASATAESERTLDAIELCFDVSRDEEHVRLRVRAGLEERDLGERAHHYVLLALARVREDDRRDEQVAASCHGWIEINDFARRLATDRTYVNLCIHRLRRQLAECGLSEAVSVVERRPNSGELRLGRASVRIRTE